MKMVRGAKVLVHCIAHCSDCGWFDEDRNYASKFAMRHAKNTGHSVGIEFGYSQHIYDYDSKNKRNEEK